MYTHVTLINKINQYNDVLTLIAVFFLLLKNNLGVAMHAFDKYPLIAKKSLRNAFSMFKYSITNSLPNSFIHSNIFTMKRKIQV